MKVPRICLNPACLYVLKPTVVKYVDGPDKDEENAKLDVIDSSRRCPRCNAKLTKYVHKVLKYVTDENMNKHSLTADEVLKQFGVGTADSKKKAEEAQAKYVSAKAQTEAQLDKDIDKYVRAR